MNAKRFKWILAALMLMGSAAACANPWADQVINYVIGDPAQFKNNSAFNQSWRALGRPYGLVETAPDNSSQVTLGDLVWSAGPGSTVTGAYITLKFNDRVEDDPKNPYGFDFIVFGNPTFKITGGWTDPHSRWQEPGFVEISQDGVTWYLIKPNILPLDLNKINKDTGFSTTTLRNYCEYTPTIGLPQELVEDGLYPDFTASRTAEEYYTVPDRQSVDGEEDTFLVDRVSGGGDAMDIKDAILEDRQGVPRLDNNGDTIPANISWFQYIRITDAYDGDSEGLLNEISTEVDAVSDVRPGVGIGEVKSLNEGDYVVITDALVTYSTYTDRYDPDSDMTVYTGECFVQSKDRTAGLRVLYTDVPTPLEAGSEVTITGHLSKSDARYTLPDLIYTVTASEQDIPAPLGMSARTLSTDMAYGLRVRTWGSLTTPATPEGDHYYCVISDGVSSVKVIWTDGAYRIPAGARLLAVTGICDREEGTGVTTLRLADPNADITAY